MRGRVKTREEGGTRRGRRGMGMMKGRSVNEGKEKGGMQRVSLSVCLLSLLCLGSRREKGKK